MNLVLPFLGQLIFKFPLLFVWFWALYLSLERWDKHPQVSRLTAIASSMFIAINVIQASLIFVQLNIRQIHRSWTFDQIAQIFVASNFLLTVMGALAWGLIIKSIFGWRKVEDELY